MQDFMRSKTSIFLCEHEILWLLNCETKTSKCLTGSMRRQDLRHLDIIIYKNKQQIRTLKLSWPCKNWYSMTVLWKYRDCKTHKALKEWDCKTCEIWQNPWFFNDQSEPVLNNSVIGTATWPFPCITCLMYYFEKLVLVNN